MTDIPGKSITLNQLDEMFANINQKTDWDMSGDMLWGYFFTHSEPKQLEIAKKALLAKGYRFVDTGLVNKFKLDEPDIFFLHVERIETHTPQTLDARNDELYRFADEFGLDSYDGMDVRPIINDSQ